MRILFIVPYVPNLVHVRSYNLLRSLAKRGHCITLATLSNEVDDQTDLEKLAPFCEQILALPLPRWRSYLNSLQTMASRDPLQSAYCWSPELAGQLTAMIHQKPENEAFDIIHIEHLRGVRYGLWLSQNQQAANSRPIPPIVWDSVDNISLLFRQASVQSRRFLSRLMTSFELPRTQRYEGWLMHQFAHVLVTSPKDRQAFLDLQTTSNPTPEITVIPNGVDADFFTPDPNTPREEAALVISGKMSYHANVTMCLNFVNQVMPLIWAKRPDVRLWLVGKDPTRELRDLGKNPAITVTGTVEDIRPYLRKATLAVAPLTYGAGIQNKVLEAMACATPVVSTPQAVSALSAVAGRDVAVGNSPDESSRIILDLLASPQQRERLGWSGKKYVEDHHRWGDITVKLEEVYYGALQNRSQQHLGN